MKDKISSVIGTFFRRFFITTGVISTFSFLCIGLIIWRAANPLPVRIPDKILLSFDFKSTLLETPDMPSLSSPSLRTEPVFHDVIKALNAATNDPRVKGFFARIDSPSLSLAQTQELRDTIHRFRKAGKFAHVYARSFAGMGSYYLASAFDSIWLQPVGTLAINGVGAEVPFVKGLLDKVGVEAAFRHKGLYKSMPETLTREGMSAPNRQMMTALIKDMSGQMKSGIIADRKISPATLDKKIDLAPLIDKEALDAKLIDRIGYVDDMLEEAKVKAGVGAGGVIRLMDYDYESSSPSNASGKKIAVIYGRGEIASKTTQDGITPEKIVPAFKSAMNDPDVVAAVFRIDSPGGSPEASESIRHAVTQMQKRGKPVVVSMGGHAASGGYWIASSADKIIAEPGTITGSIGVFGGKMVLAGLWRKLGVNWDSVSEGKNALMWSANRTFSAEEGARFDNTLDRVYDAFIDRVAEGRHLPRSKIEAVAEGRVWTGRQAKEKGLVDELGGFDLAVSHARTLAKIDPAQEVQLVTFPTRKSPLEMLLSLAMEDESEESVQSLVIDDRLLESIAARLQAETAILRMPSYQMMGVVP